MIGLRFQLGQIARPWAGQTVSAGTCANAHEWSIWGSCTRCGALNSRSWLIYVDAQGHHVAAVYLPNESEERYRRDLEKAVEAAFGDLSRIQRLS